MRNRLAVVTAVRILISFMFSDVFSVAYIFVVSVQRSILGVKHDEVCFWISFRILSWSGKALLVALGSSIYSTLSAFIWGRIERKKNEEKIKVQSSCLCHF